MARARSCDRAAALDWDGGACSGPAMSEGAWSESGSEEEVDWDLVEEDEGSACDLAEAGESDLDLAETEVGLAVAEREVDVMAAMGVDATHSL